MKKKGQAAAGAAVLLAIIAGLIIGFIVLIPPQERAELLGEEFSNGSTAGTGIDTGVVQENLLAVSPGRIDYLAQDMMEHPLPVVNIFTKTEGKIIAEKNYVYAKNGVFSEEVATFSFKVADLENTEDVLLTFEVEGIEGRLSVSLNDEEIYNAEVGLGLVEPIKLQNGLLKEENVLIFSVSSPGLAFWATNEVSLQRVRVVADVVDVAAQSSKSVFLISETEKNNLEKVKLEFQPGCNYNEAGKLTIKVNGNMIYSGVPDCDLAMVPIEFSSNIIYQGENEIEFHTEKGQYLLSHIVLVSKLKEVDFPTYYFELSHEEYQDVRRSDKRVRVTMNFVDVISSKEGDLVFNGYSRSFETKEVTYVLDFSEDVVQGSNSIKIKPKKTMEMRELRVDLVEI